MSASGRRAKPAVLFFSLPFSSSPFRWILRFSSTRRVGDFPLLFPFFSIKSRLFFSVLAGVIVSGFVFLVVIAFFSISF